MYDLVLSQKSYFQELIVTVGYCIILSAPWEVSDK
jgi:hypothetical protein